MENSLHGDSLHGDQRRSDRGAGWATLKIITHTVFSESPPLPTVLFITDSDTLVCVRALNLSGNCTLDFTDRKIVCFLLAFINN